MPRLPLRLRQTGFLLGLIVACSDGPHTPAPTPTTPAAARTDEPAPRAPEPAPQAAHSAAPAPSPANSGESAAEGRPPESGEIGSSSLQMGEVRDVPVPPAPPAGSNEETAPPEGSEEEEEEEEEEEPKPKPKQQIPCDRVGSAWISASNVTHDSVSLRWGFSTEPECDQSATFSVSRDGSHLSIDQNDPTLTDTEDIEPETDYVYTVVATSPDGEFRGETRVTTPRAPIPPTPTNFETGTITSSSIALGWDEVTGATRYEIRYDTVQPMTGAWTSVGLATTHTVTGLTPGTGYHFEVRAANNNGESDPAPASGTTSMECTRPAPLGFTATPRTSSDAIDLDWGAPSNPGRCTITYRIERRKGTSGSYSRIESSWPSTDYTDSGLDCGERYEYRVYTVADGTVGTAPSSDNATVRDCEVCVDPPEVPGTPTVSVSGNDVTISWGSVSIPQHCTSVNYRLSRNGTLRRTTSSTSYTDRNLSPGTYDYRVLAASHPGDNQSNESGAERATIPPAPPMDCEAPETPGSFSTSLSGDTVTVLWDAVPVPAHCTTVEYFVWQGSTKIETTRVTSYADRGLPAGEHCYQVSAASSPNGSESPRTGTRCETVLPPPPPSCQTPETPGSFSTSLSGDTVTVSWDAVPVPGGCTTVEYFVWQGSTKITTSSTSHADRGLPAGEHCYHVSAASGPNGSESQPTGTRCETVVPPPPTRFMAMAASSSSVDLSWTAASGADSYELRYWDTDDAEPDTWNDLGNVTAYTVTGLEADTEYEFKLRTVDGTLRSETVSVSETTTDPGGLAPPANFSAAGLTETSIRLRWRRVSEASSYELRYAEDGEPLPPVWENLGDVRVHTVTGLVMGTEYVFELRSVSGADRSPAVSASAEAGAPLVPPTNLEMVAVSRTELLATWDPVERASSYLLLLADGMGGDLVTTGRPEVALWEFSGLMAATEYCVTVTALGGGMVSPQSSPECATTWGGPPENLRVRGMSEHWVDLEWDEAPGAMGYRVYQGEVGSSAPGTEYRAGSLTGGETYAFRVAQAYVGTESEKSEALSATLPALLPPPGQPVAVAGDDGVALSWAAGSGGGVWSGPGGSGEQELGYAVERRTPPETGTWGEVASALRAREHLDASAAPGADYEYRVLTTVSIPGDVLKSSPGMPVMVMSAGPVMPANVTAAAQSSVAMRVSWDAVAGADGYEVQWRLDREDWSASVDVGSATEYVDDELLPATEYWYQVRTRVGLIGAGVFSGWSDPPTPAATEALAVPGNLMAMETSATSVRLSWEAVEEADRYNVERVQMSDGEIAEFKLPDAGASWEDNRLLSEQEYTYRVQAVLVHDGEEYESEWSEAVAVTPMLAAPELMVAVVSSVQLDVSWTAVSAATGYELAWSTDGTDWDLLYSGTDLGEEHPDLIPGTEYWYRVQSVRVEGGETARSGWSDPPTPAATEALAVPGNLMAMETSATSVRLSWEAVEEADRYNVERVQMSDGEIAEFKLPDAGASWEDDRLLSEQEYTYRVQAVLVHDGEEYESEWSEAVAVTPMLAAPELMVAVVSSVQLDVSWTAVSAATGYELAWSTDGTDWDLLYSGTDLGEEHPDLIPGTEYWYRVQSVRVEGGETARSGWSDPPTPAATEALAVPANLMAMETSATSVRLSWEAVEEADRYNVERVQMSDGEMGTEYDGEIAEFKLPDAGASWEDDRLLSEQEYTYRVQAVLVHDGEEYESEWSEAVAVTPMLAAPELMVAVVSSVQLDVSWTAVSAATGYELAWSTDGTDWDLLYSGTDLGEEHPDLIPGTEYWYRVQSVRVEGGETARSGWSDPPTTERTEALAVPANLMAMGMSATSIGLSWDRVEEADRYDLERTRMAMDAPPEVVQLPGAGTSYEDPDLRTDEEYTYRVRAVVVRSGVDYWSEWSAAVTVRTVADEGPAIPEGLTATATSPFAVEVTWEAVTGAEGYDVRRQDGEVTSVSGARHEDTDLAPETAYAYEVRSVRGSDSSDWTAPEPVTTDAFTAPENFTATVTSASEVALSWDPSPGTALEYRVRWRVRGEGWAPAQRLAETAYAVTGLLADTVYQFRVVAYRRAADGDWHRTGAVDTEAQTLAQ